MTTPIDNLVDDCLLHIFKYLDPISCVSAALVCKRWEELARRTLIKVTVIDLNHLDFCYDRPGCYIKKSSASLDIVKSALQYIGPEVKTINLDTCTKGSVVFNKYYGYRILGDYNAEEYISMLSQSCTNIEELKIKTMSIDLKFICEQFSKSNRKLKKVFLPPIPLPVFSSRFDSVEEVILNAEPDYNTQNFIPAFPNVKNLTLNVHAPDDEFESFLGSVLQQINKNLKSLNLVIGTGFKTDFFKPTPVLRMLSDISAFSQLEELRIGSCLFLYAVRDFEANSVTKLIESCQNLRVLKLHAFGFGTTDISSFLTLPKLEELEITHARFFTYKSLKNINLNQLKNLTWLKIDFRDCGFFDGSGIFKAIEMMPALKDLIVPQEKGLGFICIVIQKLINDRDIIISSYKKSLRVYKNDSLRLNSEPLKLWITTPHYEENYCEEIREFVSRLEGCSFIFLNDNEEYYLRNIRGVWTDKYDRLYTYCKCCYC